MSLILEQSFPLGRFHATRWNQNPFEDRHGEWPPSPWRLLRALAARWFQYARETGDEDEAARNALLEQLAAQPPAFHLPAFTWRGEPAPRQYQKTKVDWTDKSAKAAAYKKPQTTLVIDVFRAVSPTERVVWVWDTVDLSPLLEDLLGKLLRRILYFGRAETHCRFTMGKMLMQDMPRFELSSSSKGDSPVLVATPGEELNLKSLLASSDDRLFKGRQIPPGTEWRYARLPQCPTVSIPPPRKVKFPAGLQVIQFAVGGRVYPERTHWVRVIERFRGCVLKHAARIVSGGKYASFRELPADLRDKLKLLSGKDGEGRPLQNHLHAYFFLYPDEVGNPTRLIAYRRVPFDGIADQPFEVEAILAASREPIFWQSRAPDWSLRLVPLPFEVPAPVGCRRDGASSAVWVSATPFVTPGNRHRFRKGGRNRPGEAPDCLLRKLLRKSSFADPLTIALIDGPDKAEWVYIHATREERLHFRERRTPVVRPGHSFRIVFREPVNGPICLGHSCHFGLGLFVPDGGTAEPV
jgi:CRISPR-associated protein Csb2